MKALNPSVAGVCAERLTTAADAMTIDEIVQRLADGATLEGPHWTEPVKVLAVKARGPRVEVQAVGLHTKRLWNKLLKAEDFDGAIKVTQAGELAALTGNPTHFRLAAEAHRIRLAYQYDPTSPSPSRRSIRCPTRWTRCTRTCSPSRKSAS
jgi:hypothetical protein